jgi:CheY-like chemotaxis protein
MPLQDVLLIDDSDPDLLYTEVVLSASGVAHRILPFGTAQEALDYLQQPDGHRVDLILLDINMPEMDGFEFLAAYGQLHETHKARAVVVMLTSSPDPDDKARAMAFSCVKGYVVKPIDAASARGLVDLVDGVGRRG